IAIILGAVFVVYQIRQDDKMLAQSVRQADANATQARLTMEQVTQNSNLATMDLVMRIYELANSMEVQRSYMTVVRSGVTSYAQFEKLPEDKQLAFFQIASLFESLGFLVERGFVKAEIVDDMFATKTAWEALEPFIMGMRQKFAAEDYYFFFERLYSRLSRPGVPSITGQFLDGKKAAQDAAPRPPVRPGVG
ncbi:MAG TPA: hypothetical protein VLU99_06475, partial [Nitrososphaerales archaeon]|nr:hypothetical protein [Nitrososphaerales archaeon]